MSKRIYSSDNLNENVEVESSNTLNIDTLKNAENQTILQQWNVHFVIEKIKFFNTSIESEYLYIYFIVGSKKTLFSLPFLLILAE